MADRNYKESNNKCYTKCHVKKYSDPIRKIKTLEYKAMARALALHEDVNGRLKEWDCLNQDYRHDRFNHHILFGAVAAMTQLELHHGRLTAERTFQGNSYRDPVRVY